MRFQVLNQRGRPKSFGPSRAFLEPDNWDDFTFKTTFSLLITGSDGKLVDVGGVRIGREGMGDGHASIHPGIPKFFERLPQDYFSLGMDVSYYENLATLGPATQQEILRALGDLAVDLERFYRLNETERVIEKSLLRDLSLVTIEGPYHRLATGLDKKQSYQFAFESRSLKSTDGALTFEVRPDSVPSSNFHALIGSNGSGKTRLIDAMWRSVGDNLGSPVGQLFMEDGSSKFAGVVRVSFSAFDPIEPLGNARDDVRHGFIGLQSLSASGAAPDNRDDSEGASRETHKIKNKFELNDDLRDALKNCVRTSRGDRLLRTLSRLDSDPILRKIDFDSWLPSHSDKTEQWSYSSAVQEFDGMSSGHKTVVLALTRLVELVDERTLVLLDEPESHLHPPLLSTYVNAIADLMNETNGVALAATHSPVVLQEISRKCCSIIRRVGSFTRARRPDLATFGENVGRLTYDVFGLELTETGFHKWIETAVSATDTYEAFMARFGGELGSEGRALARFMLSESPGTEFREL